MKTVFQLNFWFLCLWSYPLCFHPLFFQENPQSNKKDELDNLDTSCDQGQHSPSEQNKGASLDSSQCSPSPASQEDPDSEISEDSDQEVDIEGDKGYFNSGWWLPAEICSETGLSNNVLLQTNWKTMGEKRSIILLVFRDYLVGWLINKHALKP